MVRLIVAAMIIATMNFGCRTREAPEGIALEEETSEPESDQETGEGPQQAPTPVEEEQDPGEERLDEAMPELTEEQKSILQAALNGPELKGVSYLGHQWNIKPAQVSWEDDVLVVTGQISHHVAYYSDNQIYYHFRFQGKQMVKNETKIEAGSWLKVAEPILDIVGTVSGTTLQISLITTIISQIESKLSDGTWEADAQRLVAMISLYIYQESADDA